MPLLKLTLLALMYGAFFALSPTLAESSPTKQLCDYSEKTLKNALPGLRIERASLLFQGKTSGGCVLDITLYYDDDNPEDFKTRVHGILTRIITDQGFSPGRLNFFPDGPLTEFQRGKQSILLRTAISEGLCPQANVLADPFPYIQCVRKLRDDRKISYRSWLAVHPAGEKISSDNFIRPVRRITFENLTFEIPWPEGADIFTDGNCKCAAAAGVIRDNQSSRGMSYRMYLSGESPDALLEKQGIKKTPWEHQYDFPGKPRRRKTRNLEFQSIRATLEFSSKPSVTVERLVARIGGKTLVLYFWATPEMYEKQSANRDRMIESIAVQ